jgi:hypothetical protein
MVVSCNAKYEMYFNGKKVVFTSRVQYRRFHSSPLRGTERTTFSITEFVLNYNLFASNATVIDDRHHPKFVTLFPANYDICLYGAGNFWHSNDLQEVQLANLNN